MRVVHAPDGGSSAPLAREVERATGFLSKLRGLMFRSTVPADYAMVFPFEKARRRSVHTLFVRVSIDVVWVEDGTVTRVETLSPWTGFAAARADTIVELRADAAGDVAAGDDLRVESGE